MAQQTAAERLVQLATRIWRAMEFALPKLPEETQAVLKMRVEDGDVRWALSLVLAGWRLGDKRLPGAAEVETVMKETGAAALIGQISSLGMFLPDSFGLFLDAARDADADHKLAGAGVYLANAVKELGDTQRGALHAWLRGVQFREAGQALIRRFPVPGSGRPPVWGQPESAPSSPPSSPKPSRSDRFDRADFLPRRSQKTSSPSETVAARVTPSKKAPPRPSTPVLDTESVARAYLFTLGWQGSDIEQLLSGPSGSQQTAGTSTKRG